MNGDKVVVNFPNPGKYGRVLQDPVEALVKPADYCTQIPPAQSLPTFEPDHQTTVSDGSNISSASSATAAPTDLTPPVEDGKSTVDETSQVTSTAASVPTITPISQENPPTDTPNSPSDSTTTTAMDMPTNMPIDGPTTTMPSLTKAPPPVSVPIFSTTISESTSIDLANPVGSQGTNVPIPGPNTTMASLTKTPPPMTIPTTLTTTISTSTSTDLLPPPGPPPATIPKPNSHAVACATHGALVCLDDAGRTFGLCNWGWATPQEVAEGTECKGGEIVKRREMVGGDGDDGVHGFIGIVREGAGENGMRRVVQDERGVPRVVMDDEPVWE